ncbi:AAA family ATPase [Kitasatospora sp. NPDC004240]
MEVDAAPPPPMGPHGVLDLRGRAGAPFTLRYPADAVVVVSGLPGSGKSTLLHRWTGRAGGSAAPAVPTVDPRAVHEACAAVMPARLPYAVYRPWARLEHARLLYRSLRRGGPLLIHDCGSRRWLRRLIAAAAARQGRELHLVLLDVGAATALAGQHARGRWASGRSFARHRRGLDRLLAEFDGHWPDGHGPDGHGPDGHGPDGHGPDGHGPDGHGPGGGPDDHGSERDAARHRRRGAVRRPVPEAASVLLLDRASRSRVAAAEFAAAPASRDAGPAVIGPAVTGPSVTGRS